MSKTFRWGIIGLGRIARKFAEDLKLVPNAQLHAVASTSMARAREFGSEFNVPHVFGSYAGLLQCPDLDVVYIATPHISHFENTMLCLEAGMPVLCEKPFAMSAHEARQMVDLAHRKRAFLMDAVWTRFVPGFNWAIEQIDSGKIGEIKAIHADFGFKAPPYDPQSRIFNKALGAGSLLDIGIYPIFLSQLLLGSPDEVTAKATWTRDQVDESCAMIFEYAHQKQAILSSSIAMTTPTEAHIFGEKGTIRLHHRWHHPQKITVSTYVDRTVQSETVDMPFEGWGYAFEAQEVMRCLEAGWLESPLLPHEFTLGMMETMDRVREQIGLEY